MWIRPLTAAILVAVSLLTAPLYPSGADTADSNASLPLFTENRNDENAGEKPEARDITGKARIRGPRPFDSSFVTDGLYHTSLTIPAGTELTVSAKEPVGAIYLETEFPVAGMSILLNDAVIEVKDCPFLHFSVEEIHASEFTIRFQEGASLNNIHLLSEGTLPDWVQRWEPTPDECDLMLMPAHYDDDTLYFGGVAPWAIDRGAVVTVAYYCSHSYEPSRKHEMLNGVWTSGVRNYPIFGTVPDSGLTNVSRARHHAEVMGYSWSRLMQRQVEIIRKYRPQVILTHSFTGEYGHGQHILYTQLATEAALKAGDETAFPDIAEQYGAFAPSKVYVHNYASETGQIVLDLDAPLESFGGRSAYDVTSRAFRCHKSQVKYSVTWLRGPGSAAGIRQYSPCQWGLYFSSVGSDTCGDDLFEHVTLLKDRNR